MITHREKGIFCDLYSEEVSNKQLLIDHKVNHSTFLGFIQHSLFEQIFPCSNCDKVSNL